MSNLRSTAERRPEKSSLRAKASFTYHALRSPPVGTPGLWVRQRALGSPFGSSAFQTGDVRGETLLSSKKIQARPCQRPQDARRQGQPVEADVSAQSGRNRVCLDDKLLRATASSSNDRPSSLPSSSPASKSSKDAEVLRQSAQGADIAQVAPNASNAQDACLCATAAEDALAVIQRGSMLRNKERIPLSSPGKRFCAKLASEAESLSANKKRSSRNICAIACRANAFSSLDPRQANAETLARHTNLSFLAKRFHQLVQKWTLGYCTQETASKVQKSDPTVLTETGSPSGQLCLCRMNPNAPNNQQSNETNANLVSVMGQQSTSCADGFVSRIKEEDSLTRPEQTRTSLLQQIELLEEEIQRQRSELLAAIACEGMISKKKAPVVCPGIQSAESGRYEDGLLTNSEEDDDELVHALGTLRASIAADEVELEALMEECDRLIAALQNSNRAGTNQLGDRINLRTDHGDWGRERFATLESSPTALSRCDPMGFTANTTRILEARGNQHETTHRASQLHTEGDHSNVSVENAPKRDSGTCSPETHLTAELEHRMVSLGLEREKAEQRAATMLQLLFGTTTSPAKSSARSRHTRMIALELVTSQLALNSSGALILSGDEDEAEALRFLERHGLVRSAHQKSPSVRCMSLSTDLPPTYFITNLSDLSAEQV